MAKSEEFDFKKEYGFDPDELLDGEDTLENGEDFDFSEFSDPQPEPQETAAPQEEEAYVPVSDEELDDLLSADFLASLGIVREGEAAPEDEEEVQDIPVLPDEADEALEFDQPLDDYEDEEDDLSFDIEQEAESMDTSDFQFDNPPEPTFSEPAFEVDTPDLGEDFAATYDAVSAEQHAGDTAEASEAGADEKQRSLAERSRNRRKMSKERIIKEVYLPPVIAVATLVLLLVFIGGAIGRVVGNAKSDNDTQNASSQASLSAVQQEIQTILAEAKSLADGYDYDAAIAAIDSFSGEISAYSELASARSNYALLKEQLVGYDDPASIANLSFHVLIVDTNRAYNDATYANAYKNNFVTTEEFSAILQELYDNGFVLVDFDSFVVETTSDTGTVTYSTTPLYLPSGKQPIMLTETLVNYETYMIDGDGDGEADKDGAGFASRLIVGTDGKITCEYVDANGNTLTGAYDFVPILEAFIEEHPDFSYQGARAILAVSGEDGVFGYRTMASVKTDKGTDYYNEQVAGAQQVAQALRDAGYTIASYTYGNTDYSEASATQIQAELDVWEAEVTPVLGEIDMIVYAKGTDISGSGEYSGSRYNVLKNAGYHYFIGAASVPWASVNTSYVRQSRIMVTGSVLTSSASTVSKYFDASVVVNDLR